jgi:hypothetical protein
LNLHSYNFFNRSHFSIFTHDVIYSMSLKISDKSHMEIRFSLKSLSISEIFLQSDNFSLL